MRIVRRNPRLLGGGPVSFVGVPDAPGPLILDFDDVARLLKANLFHTIRYVKRTGMRGFIGFGNQRRALAPYLRGDLKRRAGYLDGNPLNLQRRNLTTYQRGRSIRTK